MKEVKVLVCESHFLSKEGLKTIINKNPFFEVVDEAESQDELERKLVNVSPEIVTIDYADDTRFGMHSIDFIQEVCPRTKVLIISDDDNRRNIYDALSRGVTQYITKNCREHEIYKALDACRNNEKYYCSKILDIIIDKTFGEFDEEPVMNTTILTPREQEIVQRIALGKMAKEISYELNISVHTIYTHRKNIMKKLQISSPVELITYAINTGIVKL